MDLGFLEMRDLSPQKIMDNGYWWEGYIKVLGTSHAETHPFIYGESSWQSRWKQWEATMN